MESFITWLESHQLSCFFLSSLGIECPGCGLQRSFILLLRGDLSASLSMYPPLLPFLFLFLLASLHLLFRFKKGGSLIKWTFLFTAFIVCANFIVRLIQHL